MKKLIGIFFAFVFLTSIFTTNTLAQTSSQPASSRTAPQTLPLNTNPDVPQNINTYTQTTFINVLATASCFLTGYDPLSTDGKCLGIDPETRKIGYVKNGSGGLISLAGNLIGSTYNIPVSSVEYGKYVASNFGITHNTFAQTPEQQCQGVSPEETGECIRAAKAASTGFAEGIGFKGLTPVLKIWETFRNLVYLLFVLIFIVLGLGIMFRINIDARTVMSIQNQIPKIIIALVLITFSYAIVGFLIDLMYVSIYLVIQLFHTQGLATLTNIDTNPINAVGSLGGISDIATPAAKGVGSILGSLFDGGIGESLARIVSALLGAILGGNLTSSVPFVGSLLGGVIGAGLGLAFGPQLFGLLALIIAYLIIVIAILSALFRVWFMLIKCYVFIILDVIFAPFWIVKGIIPGAGGGVGPWLRSLLANLSAFPVVIILFLVGKTVQDNIVAGTGNFIPPLVGDPGVDSAGAVASIIGLGLILIMPEAVTITKQALKAPDYKLAGAAQRAIGVGQGIVSKPFGAIKGEYFGKDAFNNPRPGSRFVGQYLGGLAGAVTGGGFGTSDKLLKNPLTSFKNFRDTRKKGKAVAAAAKTAAEQDEKIAAARRAADLQQYHITQNEGGDAGEEPSPAPKPGGNPPGDGEGSPSQPPLTHGGIEEPNETSQQKSEGEEGEPGSQVDPEKPIDKENLEKIVGGAVRNEFGRANLEGTVKDAEKDAHDRVKDEEEREPKS